ncbi:MAG TPA: kelch repeat-containing protein [Candidatus Acidoferrales bacterium]|nr:kelch repeat-containing protein [Candidatus Acidoferrales bacterium]
MKERKQNWRVFAAVGIFLATLTGVSAVGMLQDTRNSNTTSSWSPRGPLPRNGHSAVLDTVKNKMIVFGGSTFASDAPPSAHFNDVWYLSAANSTNPNESWTIAKPAGTPPNARLGHSAVLDPVNNRMIVFGGAEGFAAPCDNDVWVLSNANGVGGTPTWTQLSPAGTPPTVRFFHGAAYDRTNNIMVVFGGAGCFGGFFNDVWTLSNANGLGGTPVWTQQSPTGTPPAARDAFATGFTQGSNQLIIFGGSNGTQFFGDTWVLDNASGKITPAWHLVVVDGNPSPREFPAAALDEDNGRLTIFGGYSTAPLNDVWVLTSFSLWRQITPTGTLPLGRYSHSAVYDPVANKMIIFGGSITAAGSSTDTVSVLSHANGM